MGRESTWPLFLLTALSVGVSLSACTRKRGPAPQPSATSDAAPAIVLDRPVFHFDYQAARSLTIDKADPSTGDHWMARVERKPTNPSASPPVFYDKDPWTIASYSENAALPDRLANRTLILHLLDTLSTLHPVKAVSSGVSDDGDDSARVAARANDGLSPPRYALSWEVWDSRTGRSRTFRVEIGAPTDDGTDSNRLAYGSFPPDRAIYELDGASLPMLEYIKDFSVLRQRILSPLASDEVDELEIRQPGKGGKTEFYAQRDGDVWSDRSHRPWKKNVQGFLDRITHLRIQNFIDVESEARLLRPALFRHAVAEIILKDRFSKPTIIRLARRGSQALAEVSTRPGAIFELYPGALSQLSP